MVDFDTSLVMELLSHYHEVVDCFSKTLSIVMSGVPPIWQRVVSCKTTGIISSINGRRIISYISCKTTWIILRVYKSYLSYICNGSMESPSLDFVLIVRKFLDVFLTNLHGFSPKHDI